MTLAIAIVVAAVVGFLAGRYWKSGSLPNPADVEAAIKLGKDVAEVAEKVAEGLDLIKAQSVGTEDVTLQEWRKAEYAKRHELLRQMAQGVIDVSTFNTKEYREVEAQKVIVNPNALDVRVGKLSIQNKGDGQWAGMIGLGTEVTLDGQPIKGIQRLTLNVGVEDIVTVDLVVIPEPVGAA